MDSVQWNFATGVALVNPLKAGTDIGTTTRENL